MYLALKEILSNKTAYEKLYVVRSLVPTREIGFLPGDHEDKAHRVSNTLSEYGKVYVQDA